MSLRFDSHQDALDFATKIVKDSKDFLATNDLDFAKRYKKSEIELVVEVCTRTESDEHHLVFRAIPDVGIWHIEEAGAANRSAKANASGSDRDGDFVFIGDAYFVECPEKVITSRVRLEPAKEGLDLLRYVLGPAQSVRHLSGTSSEGESGKFWVGIRSGQDCHGVTSVIKGVPEFCAISPTMSVRDSGRALVSLIL